MTEEAVYPWLLRGFFALAPVTFVFLFFVTAPYGRHAEKSRGRGLDSTLGWVLMETPSALGFAACWIFGDHRSDPARLALLALWELHYLDRAYVFPFRRRGARARKMPIAVLASGLGFTSINAYLNGRWIFGLAPSDAYTVAWLRDPRFVVGALLFVAGFVENRRSDRILFDLRKGGDDGYHVPHGGLFRFVSCPNYLGEIVEWIGFALAAWSLPALAFAVWTIANLVPRAIAHHKWYREHLPGYPSERRAIVPFVL